MGRVVEIDRERVEIVGVIPRVSRFRGRRPHCGSRTTLRGGPFGSSLTALRVE